MEDAEQEVEEKRLTPRQKKFIDFYLGPCNLNASRAALAAGYSERSAGQIGHENLRKPEIRKAIDERLNSNVLTPSEVLSILSTQAKGTITDVLQEDGKFDLEDAKKRGTDRLIKKLKITEKLDPEGNPIERSYDLETHDPQAAAEKVGRFHKLFTDKREISGSIATYAMSKEEWEREATTNVQNVEDHLAKFDVHETEQQDQDS